MSLTPDSSLVVPESSLEEDESFLSAEETSHPPTALVQSTTSLTSPMDAVIPASALKEKLQALALFAPSSLTAEIHRLASLSTRALQREFELREHIHKLPLEILGEIFSILQDLEIISQLRHAATIHGSEPIDYYTSHAEHDTQVKSHLIVGQVCMRWRNVVLNTGKLWRRIVINDKDPWRWTRLCLQRSGEAPLRIVIPFTDDPDADTSSPTSSPTISPSISTASLTKGKEKKQPRYTVLALQTILQLLIPHASRWQSLVIAVESYDLLFFALPMLSSISAPLLQELEISNHDDTEVGEEFEPSDMSRVFDLFNPMGLSEEEKEKIPRALKKARFWGVHCDWTSRLFSSLSSLTLAYHSEDVRPSSETFYSILSNSSETLINLSLECSGPQHSHSEPNFGWPTEPISLPALQTMKIAFLPPEYVLHFLKTIEVPSLDRIHFDLGDAEGEIVDWNRVIEVLCTGSLLPPPSLPSPLDSMFTSLRRSKVVRPLFPSIRSLGLSAFPADPTHLGLLLYCHPLVEEIVFNFHFLPEEFIYFLTAPIDDILRGMDGTLPRWAPQSLKTLAEEVQRPSYRPTKSKGQDGKDKWLLPELKVFRVYNIDSHNLRYLVETREKHGLPLKEVWYSDGSIVYRQDRVWLKEHLEVFSEFEDSDDEDEEDEDMEEELDEDDIADLIDDDDDDEEDEEEDDDEDEWEDEDDDQA